MKTCPTCEESTEQGIRFREGASECMFCEAIRDDLKTNLDVLVKRMAISQSRLRRGVSPKPAATLRTPRTTIEKAGELALEFVFVRSGLDRETMESKLKTKTVARYRMLLLWALRELGFSHREIGNFVGGRDHSTVQHAWRTTMERMALDVEFNADGEKLMTLLRSSEAPSLLAGV